MDGLIAPFFAHVKNKPVVRLLRRDGFEDVIHDGKVLLSRSGAPSPSMPVQIITWQGSVYLTTGWPEFVLSNGIQHGDVLYFELQSDMKMSVQICFRNLFANKISGKDEIGKGNADKENADAENAKRRRLGEKEKEEEAEEKNEEEEGDDREVKEIKKEDEHQQEVENDEFHIVMKKTLVTYGHVPIAYARHMPPSGEASSSDEASYVYLTGPDGKQWKVHVAYIRSRYPFLSAGWPKFQTHYKLRLDDVLRFKVIGKFRFEVVILRALAEID